MSLELTLAKLEQRIAAVEGFLGGVVPGWNGALPEVPTVAPAAADEVRDPASAWFADYRRRVRAREQGSNEGGAR